VWLAGIEAEGVTIRDVARAVAGDGAAIRCGVQPAVPPVWAGSTIATADGRDIVRCHSNGRREALTPPSGLAPDWRFVPRLEPLTQRPTARTAGSTTSA
jgi:hypothetical protein